MKRKEIKGYEDCYSVTKDGRVWSNRFKKWLKPIKHSDGYRVVHLCVNGEGKKKRIHRIVAETFLSNPDNLPEVNHKNLNKSDNRLKNLEWISHIGNSKHGYKTREKMLKRCKTKDDKDKIMRFFKKNKSNRIYPSQIYSNNIEKNRKRGREKYARNREYLKEYVKKRYWRNIEFSRKYCREYYHKHYGRLK